jgi:tetratricopeptide (TPR) repeat protein/predicted Ser/Thr protein kinase
MIGRMISHYEVLEEVGRGGMGVVYKAQDTTLDRTVALKFLPAEFAGSTEEKQRFLQEAKAASALDHTNICTVYEVGETDDGQMFIAMGYYEGETLKEKIRKGPLPVQDVIRLGVQISRALAKAHEREIIHRDIKPANILVTRDGDAKILDFGLAKLRGQAMLTKAGTTLGTAAYMSPEQARGEDVDARTDIWSLGVVVYEMLAGRSPFASDYEQAMVYQILNDEPGSLRELRPEVPPELDAIVRRCLAKDPSERISSMKELETAFGALREGGSTASRPTIPRWESRGRKRIAIAGALGALAIIVAIGYVVLSPGAAEAEGRIPVAVLDVVNETGEPELSGLSGMLITSLEQSRRLAVLTRSRMFDILKATGNDSVDRIDEAVGRQICTRAGVNAMVMASVRKFGRLYTIDLKVLDPHKNEYLFTTKEEGEGQESIPGMLDRLSDATRIGLRERIAEVRAEQAAIASVTTSNLEAYQHYFKGEELIDRLKFAEAKEEFQKAIALDSMFALAHYRLAYAAGWNQEVLTGQYIHRALELIDHLPERERYLVRAEQATVDSGWAASLRVLREMEKEYPNDKEMLYNIGDMSYHVGDYAAAEAYLSRVLEIDPGFERALQHLTWTYRETGQGEKMLAIAKRYVNASGSTEAYGLLASAYGTTGRQEEGLNAMRAAQELFPDKASPTVELSHLLMQLGRDREAEQELRHALDRLESLPAVRSLRSALTGIFLYRGQYREAIKQVRIIRRLAKEQNDSTNLASSYAYEGFLMTEGWGWSDSAWSVASRVLMFPARTWKDFNVPVILSWIQLAHENWAYADSVEKASPPPVGVFIGVVAACRRGDSQTATAAVDSLTGMGIPPDVSQILRVLLAHCHLRAGEYDPVLEAARVAQKLNAPRSDTYVRTYYLLGKAHEGLGQKAEARKNYEEFLRLWKAADADLPDLVEAQRRLAALSPAS